MKSKDIIEYVLDSNSFAKLKLKLYKNESPDYKDAINIGLASLGGIECIVCISDSSMYGGTFGQVEGEKIARTLEIAVKKKLPVICFLDSGGARIQEGVFSLLQMTKIVSALQKHRKKRILLISVVCEYVYGGVYASLLGLSDIVIMEKNGKLGFAGKKVIDATYGKECSTWFQRSEFAMKNGLVDLVVTKNEIRETIYKLLKLHEV